MWLNTRSHLNMTILESYTGGTHGWGGMMFVVDTSYRIFLSNCRLMVIYDNIFKVNILINVF